MRTRRSNLPRTVALVVILVVLLAAPLAPPSAVAAEKDSVEQLIEHHGCNKIKSLAAAPAQKAFQDWAKEIAKGDVQGYAREVAENGNVGWFLENVDTVVKGIQIMEELVSGSPMKAAEIGRDWGFDLAFAWIGGPHVAAGWTVTKELVLIAKALNAEMLQLNLANYADAAVDRPELLSLDYYMNQYLHWKEPSPPGITRLEITRRRAMLEDYATIVLQQKDFPRYLDWDQHQNRIRSLAMSMLRELRHMVELRRKQRALAAELPAMRGELLAVKQFEHFWGLIQGVTCQEDTTDDCGSALTEAAPVVLRAEAIALPSAAVKVRNARSALDGLELALDQGAAALELERSRVAAFCAEASSAHRKAKAALEASWDQGNEAAVQRDRARTAARDACGAEEETAAAAAASRAERAAAEARRSWSAMEGSRARLEGLEVPPATDLDPVHAWMRRANDAFSALYQRSTDLEDRRDRILEAVRQARGMLVACDHLPDSGALADLRRRLSALETTAEGASSSADESTVATLERRHGSAKKQLASLEKAQSEARECLDDLPDLEGLRGEMDSLLDATEILVEDASEQAERARDCAEALGGDEPLRPTPEPPDDSPGDDEPEGSSGGGWEPAGDLVTISGPPEPGDGSSGGEGSAGGGSAAGTDPDEASGEVDLRGWIDSAKAAYAACRFDRALWYADRIAAHDPSHPWLLANHERIRRQKQKQDAATRSLRAARRALQGGNAKGALASARAAARDAPSCMSGDIASAISSIRDQIHAEREANREKARDAAATILTGLIGIATTIAREDGGSGGTGVGTGGGSGGATGGSSTATRETCYIQEYPDRGEVTMIFRQSINRSGMRHDNYYVLSVDEEDAGDVSRAFVSRTPNTRRIGTYRSYGSAMREVRRLCPNPYRR